MNFVWHIPTPGSPTPTLYVDRDCEPLALRIYAERAPDATLLVDVLDDGVSIMNSNDYQKWTFVDEAAYIEFGTPSGTFTVKETITGGTSGVTAKVSANRVGRLTLYDVSGVFTLNETITGGSSSATGVVNSFVRAKKSAKRTTESGQSHASLVKGETSSDAAHDFKPGVDIREGSWLSLSVIAMAGAQNVTVQLDVTECDRVEGRR